MNVYTSMSLSAKSQSVPWKDRFFWAVLFSGMVIWLYYAVFGKTGEALTYLISGAVCLILGSIFIIRNQYRGTLPGIQNNGVWFRSLSGRGLIAWLFTLVLTGFYILIYWFPETLGLASAGGANTGLISLFDPLSMALKGKPASQWFLYGVLYTLVMLILGVKYILKYRHNRYQVIRTCSLLFFQLIFAFLLPEILQGFQLPYQDLKNVWPLQYYFFFDWHLDALLASGNFGYFVIFWGLMLTFIATPILTYYFGKRWYCSWVCGCGGLAETAGDSFRHLSDKRFKAWKMERWLVHGILGFVIITTIAVLLSRFYGWRHVFGFSADQLSAWYGFFIGATFSGVIGVGLYPILGSRVWCRFGCPMAAYLGILQKYFSRFRITVNGGQCISCGNCSVYCEMGIDVKQYAEKGQDIIRASCVGCGVCSAVCPRGVLKLENKG